MIEQLLAQSIAGMPVVVLLVALVKRYIGFIPNKYAPYVNGVICAVLVILAKYTGVSPDVINVPNVSPALVQFINALVEAVIMFAGSSGLYQLGRAK